MVVRRVQSAELIALTVAGCTHHSARWRPPHQPTQPHASEGSLPAAVAKQLIAHACKQQASERSQLIRIDSQSLEAHMPCLPCDHSKHASLHCTALHPVSLQLPTPRRAVCLKARRLFTTCAVLARRPPGVPKPVQADLAWWGFPPAVRSPSAVDHSPHTEMHRIAKNRRHHS